MSRILVTPRSVTAAGGHPALSKLKDAGYEIIFSPPGKLPTQDDLLRLLPGCIGYLAGVEEINARVLNAARGLKVISRNGAGVDKIDMAEAERLGIIVCKAVGANARGVAELTMAHILSLARWIPFSDKGIKAGGWKRRKGIELIGRTLGVVGCGNIGRLVVKFALGMDMKVLAFDIKPDESFAPSGDFRYATLDELLENSDIISLHCPALPARASQSSNGKCLINAETITRMKKGVFLINTARADLIDEKALAAALESGQIAGAAMDVFKTEPPTGDILGLLSGDRIIATPHLGGFTDESVDRAVQMAVDNLLAELK